MILTVEDEEGIMDDEVFSLEDEDPGGGRKKSQQRGTERI